MAVSEMDYMNIGLLDFNNPNAKLPASIVQVPTFPTGYTNYSSHSYYYKIGTRVFLNIGVNKDDETAINKVTLFTLPEGFRPYKNQYTIGMAGGGTSSPFDTGVLSVLTTGTVRVSSPNKAFYGFVEFDAFN